MQGSKEKIALFDFCETLVSFQTADAFVRFVGEATGSARVSRMLRIHHFLDRKGIIGRLYKLFPESSPGKRLVARGLKGFREDALDELAGRYYAQRLRPALIPEVVGRLRSLQRDGWRIVLVSGASIAISPFAIPAEKTVLGGINSSLVIDLPLMLGVMAIMCLPALIKGKLQRWQGILLLCIYASFTVYQFVA